MARRDRRALGVITGTGLVLALAAGVRDSSAQPADGWASRPNWNPSSHWAASAAEPKAAPAKAAAPAARPVPVARVAPQHAAAPAVSRASRPARGSHAVALAWTARPSTAGRRVRLSWVTEEAPAHVTAAPGVAAATAAGPMDSAHMAGEPPAAPAAAPVVAEAAPVASAPPAESVQRGPAVAVVHAPPAAKPVPPLARVVDLQVATVSTRYRLVDNSDGVTTANHMQHNESVRGRLKFDAAGRYGVGFALGTGNNFIGGWNATGVGTPGDLATTMYLKQLYASFAPVKGFEIQAGGLGIVRGENTEITSYDNDGYMMGERITVRRRDALFFDEVSATRGYLGDPTSPSVFDRYDRLQGRDTNYYQVLVGRKVNARVAVSADYTQLAGTGTVRSGVAVKVAGSRVVDLVRVEGYRRLGAAAAGGFAAQAEKAVTKRVTVGGGLADVDADYGGLNADRFGKGRRLFASASVTLLPELSVQSFYQHAFMNDYPLAMRSRFEVIAVYNVLKSLQRGGLF